MTAAQWTEQWELAAGGVTPASFSAPLQRRHVGATGARPSREYGIDAPWGSGIPHSMHHLLPGGTPAHAPAPPRAAEAPPRPNTPESHAESRADQEAGMAHELEVGTPATALSFTQTPRNSLSASPQKDAR